MRIRIVDAFADRPFTGNPAGVLLLDAFPDDTRLQRIALEVNHAETAFAHRLPEGGEADWALRWFTPAAEVAMCGHATLATAHVLHTTGAHTGPGPVRFATRSGVLLASPHEDGSITLDFPTAPLIRVEPPTGVAEALGAEPLTCFDTGPNIGDLLIEVADEKTVLVSPPTSRPSPPTRNAASSPPPAPTTPPRATTSSRAVSSHGSASTRTRSPAAPTPPSPLTGPSASAVPASPASKPPPAPAWSARNSAATAPC